MSIQSGNLIETSDNAGATKCYQGTATTTPAAVPGAADKVISQVGITNTGSNSMQISFDGGTTYTTLLKKEFISWDVKGQPTQLYVKTPTLTTTYDIIINFEDF